MSKNISQTKNDSLKSLTFSLTGQLDSYDFDQWLERHARKLGVEFEITQRSSRLICIEVAGAGEMIEAFALAASLGPKSVNIDELTLMDPPSNGSQRYEN
jgi:acylphosphatase